MNAYITGICGFAGSWLAAELLARGYRVRGAALPGEPANRLVCLNRKITVDRFDITDPEACAHFLVRARPGYLFHLAAISSVGQSFSMGELTFRVNVTGTINVLAAVKNRKWLKKIIFASSSDVYGKFRPADLPLQPQQAPNPVSPYAQSKTAAELAARMFFEQYDLPVVIVRSFNHTGPKQAPDFAIPAFCKKIAAAENGSRIKIVTVGNLAARRDISDVRDIVKGYRLLAEKGLAGEVYHLCSGRSYRIGDLLNKLITMSDTPIKVKRDASLYRKVEIPELRGSYAKTKRVVGYKPGISIDATLRDTLNFWRQQS